MIIGKSLFKNYQKKTQELETFQPIKQEIVYKINEVVDGEQLLERQRENFKQELIEKIELYLLDLPIGDYKVKYNETIGNKKLKGSDGMYIHIDISNNKYRSMLDKILNKNKKSIVIYVGGLDTTPNYAYNLMKNWEINSILKFHNLLEQIMLTIGEEYGYKPKPQSQPEQECNT
jgi:capsid portal protein